jgi:hypothetical protein
MSDSLKKARRKNRILHSVEG